MAGNLRITFCCAADHRMPSTRYRALIPGQELSKLGHQVRVGPPRGDEDAVIFSKHFQDEDRQRIRKSKALRLYDVCDDHFQTQHRNHYLSMIEAADVVTCTTTPMADIIRQETGREAFVIPDPYEFPEDTARLRPHKRPRILWYGHSVNLDTLEPWIDRLKDYDVKVVTNKFPKTMERAWVKVAPWSPAAMMEGFHKTDLVFIPTRPDDRRKSVKSHNRPLEAIRQGRYPVMGHLPSYEQFDMLFVGDDMLRGVREALAEPKKHEDKIAEAQHFIRSRYAPHVVAQYWLKAIREAKGD